MKFGGGGMKDLQKMMKQAQKMQSEMMEKQGELESKEYEGSAGGMVKVVVTGRYDVVKVSIDPEAIDPEEREDLEEMVQMATNSAIQAAREELEALTKSMTAGLSLPGL